MDIVIFVIGPGQIGQAIARPGQGRAAALNTRYIRRRDRGVVVQRLEDESE